MVTGIQNVIYMMKKSQSDPDGCSADILAMQDTMEIIGGKWTLRIVHYLLQRIGEVSTFKKIEKDIDGISAKMLSKELKLLEINQIVTRTELPTNPISVQYTITPYGASLEPLIQMMVNWGTMHRLKIIG